MKLNYEENERFDDDVIAFIHKSGSLIIRNNEPSIDEKYCLVVVPVGDDENGGSSSFNSKHWWDTWFKDATKKFYAGDELTITF